MATLTERLLLIVDADSQGAAREFGKVGDAAEKSGKSVGQFGDTMKKGLAFGAGAIVAGGLVETVLGVGQAFLDSAKGVQQFAAVTNSTTKEASQFMGMAQAMGLDVNDLLEIVAESVPNFQKYRNELQGIGVELQKNADGSVNVAASLVDALEGLQGMEDGAERMQLAMKLFGEEGSKQLAAIYNGSKPVQEALEDLDLGISDAEIAKAQRFNEAMTDLRTSGRDLGFALASAVLPALTTLAQVAGPLADALSKIPPELILIGGGLLAFQRFTPGFAGIGAGIATLVGNFQTLRAGTDLAGESFTKMQAAGFMAKGALGQIGSSISAAFGGPVGLSIAAVATGIGLVESGVASFAAKLKSEGLPRLAELEKQGLSTADALEQTASEMLAARSNMEKVSTELKSSGWEVAISPAFALTDAILGTGDAADKAEDDLRKLREEQGLLASLGADTAKVSNDLAEAIATYGENSAEAAAAAEAAAESKRAEEEATAATERALSRALGTYNEAEGAIDGLANAQTYLANAFYTGNADMGTFLTTMDEVASTTAEAEAAQDAYEEALERLKRPLSEVVQLQRDYAGLQRSMADAQDGLTAAIEASRETTDDLTTDVDESAAAYRGVAEAAASLGDAAIDSAESIRDQYGPGSQLDAAVADQIAQLEAAKSAPGITPEASAELDAAIGQLQAISDEALTVSQTPANVAVTITGAEDVRSALATLFPGKDFSSLTGEQLQYVLDVLVGTTGVPEAQGSILDLLGPEGVGWSTDVGVTTSGTAEALNAILDILGPSAPGSGIAAPNAAGRAWQAGILVELLGSADARTDLDTTSEDRTASIAVESTNGPAVDSYIDGVAAPGGSERLAEVRVESRNGPAVISYLDSIATERLAIIRVESRNGPAVITYLDSITAERLAIIRVETRNGPAVDTYLDSLASNFGAGRTAVISQQNAAAPATLSATNRAAPLLAAAAVSTASTPVVANYTIRNEVATGVNPVEVGRATVNAIRAFERAAGRGWRASS